jgi:alpha-glucoside transport system substrate-binding protein
MLRRWWMILIAVAALVAAACGDGDVGQQADEDGDGGGGAIEVAAVWTGTEQANFERVLDAFTEETGIETSYRSTGDDVGAFLGTQIEGGSPPDVAMIPQPGLIQQFADQGSLQEVGEEAAANLQENYAPIWTEIGSVDGTLYAVYFKVANKSTWWYNTAVFEQAGVQPPADWDEMLQTAGTVNASGVPWVAIGGADGWTLTDWFENIYLRSAGPEAYDQLANHEIKWTDQSVIDALGVFAELVGEPDNLAGGTNGALQTTFPDSVIQAFSDPPEAATVFEADFVVGVITGETEAQAGQDFDFFPFPAIEGSPDSVITGGDAAVTLTGTDEAQQFLAFLATPEAAEAWASQGGFISPNSNLDLATYPDDLTRAMAEELVGAEDIRFDLSDLQPAEFGATTGQGLFKLFQDFLKNPENAEQVASEMEKAAAQAFGE